MKKLNRKNAAAAVAALMILNAATIQAGAAFKPSIDNVPSTAAVSTAVSTAKSAVSSTASSTVASVSTASGTAASAVKTSSVSVPASSTTLTFSNSGITAYTNAKYAAADVIPSSNYLTAFPFNKGNAWVLSNSAPAFFIGNMSKAENERICNDTANFDLTNGTTDVGWSVKFPKANVIGALEVYSAANIEKSNARFPADINTGYAAITNNMGYTLYRNVDKEATEALPENEGKIVYGYAGGTEDVNGSTDPSGIDAEASIAGGAHIIYAQTNDSGKDFHQRKTASLKK